MTRDQWDDAMIRWMHRNDITSDLDTVWTFAVDQFYKSWMRSGTEALYADDDALLDSAPRVMHHAGMMFLHELAQDDPGLQREATLFNDAMTDFVHWWSLNNTNTDMLAKENA